MLLSIGTRVRFIHTGDEGVVRKQLEDDMVMVYLDSIQMEIPVFEIDLERVGSPNLTASVKAKIVPGKQEKEPILPDPPLPDIQYTVLQSMGIQLAFDPVLKQTGLPEKYEIYLVNDMPFAVLYNIDFSLNEEKEESWSGTIASMSFEKLDELFYDELNDFPVFDAECYKITTEGKGVKHFKNLKIKPKVFFKNVKTIPFLNKKCHWYALFENLDNQVVKVKEDLTDYTKLNVSTAKKKTTNFKKYKYTSPTEFAEFVPEIDLHIENLTSNSQKMTNAQIMQLQLQKFEEFLAKAIRLGVPQVFIIHGLGKGRLRDEIATRLRANAYVEDFKNEYHTKYGWGATEVML